MQLNSISNSSLIDVTLGMSEEEIRLLIKNEQFRKGNIEPFNMIKNYMKLLKLNLPKFKR